MKYTKTGKESGYERHGMVQQDSENTRHLPHETTAILRGNLARKSESIMKQKWDKRYNKNAKPYDLISHNCQLYVDDVLKTYIRLAKSQNIYSKLHNK